MKAFEYAEALHGSLKGKNAEEAHKVFTRFLEVVRARGHDGLLRLIPQELDKIALRDASMNKVVFVTADEKSRSKWSYACDHYRREGLVPSNEVDPTIIGGYKIRTKNLLIDGSYHRTLVELYRNIITKN